VKHFDAVPNPVTAGVVVNMPVDQVVKPPLDAASSDA